MTEKNNKSENEKKLDSLFKAASEEAWTPRDGFDTRILARMESETGSLVDIGVLAWRILPFTATASLVIALFAFTGEPLLSIVYSTMTDPLAIEGVMSIITG